MNSLPICPMVDCDTCGMTLDREDLPMPERNQCLDCLGDESVAYGESQIEKALGL